MYIGYFKQNNKEGLGVLNSQDSLFFGFFKNDFKHGFGYLTYNKSDSIIIGFWY
jgi:hypothetical protein